MSDTTSVNGGGMNQCAGRRWPAAALSDWDRKKQKPKVDKKEDLGLGRLAGKGKDGASQIGSLCGPLECRAWAARRGNGRAKSQVSRGVWVSGCLGRVEGRKRKGGEENQLKPLPSLDPRPAVIT